MAKSQQHRKYDQICLIGAKELAFHRKPDKDQANLHLNASAREKQATHRLVVTDGTNQKLACISDLEAWCL